MRSQAVLVDRPATNWQTLRKKTRAPQRALAEFQHIKKNILCRLNVDLVHFPGNTINPIDLELPIVLSLHDLQHRHFPRYFTGEELANRETWWTKSAARADALLAGSNYIRGDLERQLNVEAAKIFVTPDAFQSAFFAAQTPDQLKAIRGARHLPGTFSFTRRRSGRTKITPG